jgi:L-amino acid N-acyltransferase YncA
MTMPSRVRFGRIGNLPSIIEIYNAAIPSGCSTGDSEPAKAEDKLAWFNAHDRGSHPLWVAEESGMVVGWAGLCPFYGRPAFAKTAELSLYIAPQHRRHGFGRRLVRRVIKRCPSLGVDTLLAFVFAHNAPMVLMLEGLGFGLWGCLPGVAEVYSVRRDLLILGKTLC